MRVTLDLPDALVKDLLKITGEKKKTRAICMAVEDFIRRKRREKLLDFSGKIHFEWDWEGVEEEEEESSSSSSLLLLLLLAVTFTVPVLTLEFPALS